MMDIKAIAKYYNTNDFTVLRELNPRNEENDKRYVYLIKFDDGQELAVKVCKNNFTTPEKITGWKKTCKHYLELDIYCPQIVNSLSGKDSETVIFNDEIFTVYAEEMKKYKCFAEFEPKPEYCKYKDKLIECVGKAASGNQELVPYPSVYCVFVKFDEDDITDENYQNAEYFCKTLREKFPHYELYSNKIWDTFTLKRKQCEPVYHKLPKAVFQADLNETNILLNDDREFAGLIDFNLSGTESVLCYILLPEVCLYNLKTEDLEQLNNKEFLEKCDKYLYDNLNKISKYYHFTDYEKENFNLCYNTITPFCCWMINGMLKYVIQENKEEHIEKILDWVYYQLTRNDFKLSF